MDRMTRRELLTVGLKGLGIISLSGSVPAFLPRFAFADPATQPATQPSVSNDNVLVVVQLSGGNDGLNTIVPLGNDDYLKARPNLGLKDKLHKLDDRFALNPGMGALKELYDGGQLAVVNGCGYPQPDRSHFRSMEIWHTANPGGYEPNGWLGHYLDHMLRGTQSSLHAVNIGPELPQALVSDGPPAPSIQSIDEFQLRTDDGTRHDRELEQQIIRELNAIRESTPALAMLSRQATNAIIEAEQIHKAASGYEPDVEYPNTHLGRQLRLVAQIIAGQFGTKLFYAEMGGFDTHANQAGHHEYLLRQVSEAIAAFHKDMKSNGLGGKVAVMCFSEFGRRVAQNDSNGTDHGAAGPMFVCGGKVKGGLYGDYPSLADLDDGDLKHTIDFRRVYATMLDRWLACDSKAVLKQAFEPLPIL